MPSLESFNQERLFALKHKVGHCLSKVEPRTRAPLQGGAFCLLERSDWMKLFNTMTNRKEEFTPIEKGKVSIYVCGPTVYNHAHIGNVRPLIVFDTLRRLFEFEGNDVTFVSNYTDVDDKIIKRAIEEGVSEKEITDTYINAYEAVRDGLHVLAPTYSPRVTKTMDQIIAFIDALIQKGAAYEVDGDVYFRVSSDPSYGCLSKIRTEDLIEGASQRVDDGVQKESPLDFALWKKTNEGIQWDSPWSKGRPGWHTECVVMINELFEDGKIDIHGGGQDLKFPHHENEIAQSEAFNHHAIANYWMHNQMINIDGQKMSKSLGNVIWAKDLIEMLGTNVIRWLMLSTHYRNPLNFSDEVIKNIQKEVSKVETVVHQTALQLQVNKRSLEVPYDEDVLLAMATILNDDLNTSNALTAILNQVKVLNASVRSKEKDWALIEVHYATLIKMCDLMGLVFDVKILSQEDIELYHAWTQAKASKDFATADQLRATLIERGIL